MQNDLECLKAFISSPGDVAEERKVVGKVLHAVNQSCKDILGVEIESVTWENFAPQTPNLPDESIQDILNKEIPKCQIFILIHWKKYGSLEPGADKSNTERESEIALDLLRTEKKNVFLTYFRRLEPIEDPGQQRKSVENFRERLQSRGVWTKEYDSVASFEEILTHDIYRIMMKHRFVTKKITALNKFWVFGTPNRPTYPNLAIIYPSMDRTFMGPFDDPDVWLNRLEPNLVFEDYKALQKLEKTLRLIGYKDFKIFNSANIPPDVKFMNRFWVCLPRNSLGAKQLGKYKEISRFEIIPRINRKDSYILWKATVDSEPFKVHSPLAEYLREQRSKMDISGNWGVEMDHIVAKDYAVLGRFREMQDTTEMDDPYLNDYFLSGIRGLGTWGAAWFIDRKFSSFEKIQENEDFQFLLEIEYRNGRIFDVNNVSDKPKSYFEKQNNLTTVKKAIAGFREN